MIPPPYRVIDPTIENADKIRRVFLRGYLCYNVGQFFEKFVQQQYTPIFVLLFQFFYFGPLEQHEYDFHVYIGLFGF